MSVPAQDLPPHTLPLRAVSPHLMSASLSSSLSLLSLLLFPLSLLLSLSSLFFSLFFPLSPLVAYVTFPLLTLQLLCNSPPLPSDFPPLVPLSALSLSFSLARHICFLSSLSSALPHFLSSSLSQFLFPLCWAFPVSGSRPRCCLPSQSWLSPPLLASPL